MKTKLASFLVFAALTVFASTNDIHLDVLLTAQGNFTNATIIRHNPAYAVVDYPGGLLKVADSNLPPDLQKQFGYSPSNAAAFIAAEKENKKQADAAYRAYLASLAGTNRVIQVVAVIDNLGQCQTSVGRVYLTGVPASVNEYANQYSLLKSSIVSQQEKADRLNRMTLSLDHPEVGGEGNLANLDLKKMESDLAKMEPGLIHNTSVVAYPTGTMYGPAWLPLWHCVGVAR